MLAATASNSYSSSSHISFITKAKPEREKSNLLFAEIITTMSLLLATAITILLMLSSNTVSGSFAPGWDRWNGWYDCIIDGHPSVLVIHSEIGLVTEELGNGSARSYNDIIYNIWFSDNGAPWATMSKRSFTADDPPSQNRRHILPVEHSGNPWLLVMHGGPEEYISGYTTWRGTMYGFQCQRQ